MKSTFMLAMLLASSALFAQSINTRGDGALPQPEGEKVWNAVSQLPYAAEGSGHVLYALAYSSCPYTAAFYRDTGGKTDGVEIRWILYPIDESTANTTADAARSRNAGVVADILSHKRTSPPVRSSPQLVEAYNRVANGIPQLNSIFAEFRHYHVISPTFIWKSGETTYVSRGYQKDHFQNVILRMLTAQK